MGMWLPQHGDAALLWLYTLFPHPPHHVKFHINSGFTRNKTSLFLLHTTGELQTKFPLFDLCKPGRPSLSPLHTHLHSPPCLRCALRIPDEAVKCADSSACRHSPRAIPGVINTPTAGDRGHGTRNRERGRTETAGDSQASTQGREGNIWISSCKSYKCLENTARSFPLFISCLAPTLPALRRTGARQLQSTAVSYTWQRMGWGGRELKCSWKTWLFHAL